MKKIKIFDTTLRDGEQSPGCSMHINEKLDIAEALEKMGVDVIEAGFPASSDGDFKSVRAITDILTTSAVAALCRCRKEDIDLGYAAVKGAKHPVLHVFIATSPIHLQYKLGIDENTALTLISECTKYARSLVEDVEFSFEDATRTPLEFLAKAAETAISAGASTINIPDTVGYCSPDEIFSMLTYLKSHVKGIDKAAISVHCHNDLGMAVANSLSAINAGATQIECTVNGIGERAGNASLEEIVMAIKTRADHFNAFTDIDTTKIYNMSKLVSSVIGVKIPPNKAIVGANAFLHEAGIHQHGVLKNKATYEIMSPEDIGVPSNNLLLGKHSGKHAFSELVEEMGYSLSPEELDAAFKSFKELADRKKNVSRNDIEAFMGGSVRRSVASVYVLKDYEVTSYKGSASAVITLKTEEGKTVTEHMTGDGPVDAGFKAISSLTGQDFKLADYQVHAVTEGKDALGEAMVRLSSPTATVTGKGVSTDVLEASLLAYIDATNKLLPKNNGNI